MKKTQFKKVNWIGLASGILLIAVTCLSIFYPWWQLKISDFVYANISPFNTNFSILGTIFLIPLLFAINISSLLILTISSILMIIYSINPTKSYSKQLLCWSYKKPLYIVISFIVVLVVITLLVQYIASQYANVSINIPLMGTSVIQIPSEILGGSGVEIGIAVSGSFQLPFWLAIVATALCIAARLYHGRVAKAPKTEPATATSPTETAATDETT